MSQGCVYRLLRSRRRTNVRDKEKHEKKNPSKSVNKSFLRKKKELQSLDGINLFTRKELAKIKKLVFIFVKMRSRINS